MHLYPHSRRPQALRVDAHPPDVNHAALLEGRGARSTGAECPCRARTWRGRERRPRVHGSECGTVCEQRSAGWQRRGASREPRTRHDAPTGAPPRPRVSLPNPWRASRVAEALNGARQRVRRGAPPVEGGVKAGVRITIANFRKGPTASRGGGAGRSRPGDAGGGGAAGNRVPNATEPPPYKRGRGEGGECRVVCVLPR